MGYTADYVRGKSADQIAAELTSLSNARIQCDNKLRMMRAALEEAESTLALMESPAREDPEYATAVQQIGGGYGYAEIMSSAEALWRQMLARDGMEGVEHVHGPARLTVEKTLAVVRKALGACSIGEKIVGLKDDRARQAADEIAARVFHLARFVAAGDERGAEDECEALAKELAAIFVKLDHAVHN